MDNNDGRSLAGRAFVNGADTVPAVPASIPRAGPTHSRILAAIYAVMMGDYPSARGFGSEYATAHELGLLTEETQMRPCKTCGTPRPDFSFPRVTLAGQAYMAVAQAMEARQGGDEGSVHDSAVHAPETNHAGAEHG